MAAIRERLCRIVGWFAVTRRKYVEDFDSSCPGHRKYGESEDTHLCTTLALYGILSVATTSSKDSPPPIIADLVPGHTKLSNSIVHLEAHRLISIKSLQNSSSVKHLQTENYLSGREGQRSCPIWDHHGEEFDCQAYISDDNIALLFDNYTNLRSFYGREDDHNAMVIRNDGGNICLAFTCMQIASTIASPANVHRVGNFAIGFLHEWIRAFLVLAGAPWHEIFPPFASMKESLLHLLLTKSGSAEITRMLRENDLLPNIV